MKFLRHTWSQSLKFQDCDTEFADVKPCWSAWYMNHPITASTAVYGSSHYRCCAAVVVGHITCFVRPSVRSSVPCGFIAVKQKGIKSKIGMNDHQGRSNRWTAAQYTPCLKKTAKLFLSQVRQMSTKFDNFWHTDSTVDRFM